MGNGNKTAPAPAAKLSTPFYLGHRMATLSVGKDRAFASQNKVAEIPTAEELVLPRLDFPHELSLDADFSYPRVVNRWLYIFQQQGGKWTWTGEYWVDESGGYHPVDMKQAKGKERNQRPQPAKEALPLLSLPYQVDGKQVFAGFFLSGTRLTLHTIHRMETEGEDLWRGLDRIDLNPDLYPHQPEYGPYYGGQGWVRVTDPLWYAMSLNKVMQQLRDLMVSWLVPAKDLDPATRQRTDDRNKKKLVAEVIKAFLDNDPKDDLGLRNEFASNPIPTSAAGGEAVMRKWLQDYKKMAEWWEQNVNAAAHMLIGELESRRMKL